jgi:hypothetical protein
MYILLHVCNASCITLVSLLSPSCLAGCSLLLFKRRPSSRGFIGGADHDAGVLVASSSESTTSSRRYRWGSVWQSTSALLVATILAVYGSHGLWTTSRQYTRDALSWSAAAHRKEDAARSDMHDAIQSRDRIAALQERIQLLRREADFDDNESDAAENLVQIMESLKKEEMDSSSSRYSSSSCDSEQDFFCDFWTHFDRRSSSYTDTTHWKALLSDAKSAEHQLTWLTIRSQQLRTDQSTDAQQLHATGQQLTVIETSLQQDVQQEKEDRERASLFLQKAVSKAQQASLVAIIALWFTIYGLVRLVASVPLADYWRCAYVVVWERHHIMFALQHQLIWLLIMLLMNQYLAATSWNPLWTMLATAVITGFVQVLHFVLHWNQQHQSPSSSATDYVSVMGGRMLSFTALAGLHTLTSFLLFGQLVVLDWHVRMTLFAVLIFSWYTKQGCGGDHHHVGHSVNTWTAEETVTLATEASPLHQPSMSNKNMKELPLADESIVYVEGVSSSSSSSSSSRAVGLPTLAMAASWDLLVLALGYRLFGMVGPIAWQVNPLATVFAETFILYVAISTIHWPIITTTIDPTLPRTIHVEQ